MLKNRNSLLTSLLNKLRSRPIISSFFQTCLKKTKLVFSAYGGGGHHQWGVPGGLRAGHGDGGATVQVKGVPGSLRAGQGDGGTTGQVKGVPGGLRALAMEMVGPQ